MSLCIQPVTGSNPVGNMCFGFFWGGRGLSLHERLVHGLHLPSNELCPAIRNHELIFESHLHLRGGGLDGGGLEAVAMEVVGMDLEAVDGGGGGSDGGGDGKV